MQQEQLRHMHYHVDVFIFIFISIFFLNLLKSHSLTKKIIKINRIIIARSRSILNSALSMHRLLSPPQMNVNK